MLYIHVAGAVRYPGVYQLADGSRVFNAVHAAGGALPKGDTDAVNLAEKLEDGEKIVVPLKGQNDDFDADSGAADSGIEDAGSGSAASARQLKNDGSRRQQKNAFKAWQKACRLRLVRRPCLQNYPRSDQHQYGDRRAV